MDDIRIIELEKKMAYQDHTIFELNEVVFNQQKQIDHLEAVVKILKDQFRSLKENLDDQTDIPNRRPPHY